MEEDLWNYKSSQWEDNETCGVWTTYIKYV